MNKPYILSPAGSYQALLGAVNGGADEVYFGFGEFNARQNAQNFTDEDLKEAIRLCRILGVKTNITVNTLVTDKEMPRVLDLVYNAASMGADAFIVQDLGLARSIKKEMPSVCLHASTQCACHNSEGALRLRDIGFDRVVLAREMPKSEIQKITSLGIETEIFIHGALCVCHSGMCLMSSVIGKRSGNRGLCAQPCRLSYSFEEKTRPSYPLSLKDSCLGTRMEDILELGVTSLKIEGRMKSPDYVYNTTKIWREIVDGKANASARQIDRLEKIFSRGGFTDKYFTGEYKTDNKDMYGIRSDVDKENSRLLSKEEPTFEARKRHITLQCTLCEGKNALVTAECDGKSAYYTSDFICQSALERPLDEKQAEESLSKLGATHFVSDRTTVNIEGSVFLAKSQLNLLRRQAVSALEDELLKVEPVARDMKKAENEKHGDTAKRDMQLLVSCRSFELAAGCKDAKYVSVPLEEFLKFDEKKQAICNSLLSDGKIVGVRLPRVMFDSEKSTAEKLVNIAKEKGIVFAEISNIGHIDICKNASLELFGSIGMNVFNSETFGYLASIGFTLVCLSPELNEAQIRDIKRRDGVKACAFAKGRLPLMVLESCIMKANGRCTSDNCKHCGVLTDRIAKEFKIYGESRLEENHIRPCRNILVNSVEADILGSDEKIRKMNVDTCLVYIWEQQ